MQNEAPRTTANALLTALSAEDFRSLESSMEHVDVEQNLVLFLASKDAPYVYFPETAVVGLTSGGGNEAVQVATAGREGFAGLHVLLHSVSPSMHAVVQIGGTARRMKTKDFERALQRSAALATLLHQYTDAFLLDLAHTAACNARHRLRERCARWLASAHDRVGRDTFVLSRKELSSMLGSHDEGATAAMRALQDAAIIRAQGDSISILNGSALREAACPCYGTARQRFARLGTVAA